MPKSIVTMYDKDWIMNAKVKEWTLKYDIAEAAAPGKYDPYKSALLCRHYIKYSTGIEILSGQSSEL